MFGAGQLTHLYSDLAVESDACLSNQRGLLYLLALTTEHRSLAETQFSTSRNQDYRHV